MLLEKWRGKFYLAEVITNKIFSFLFGESVYTIIGMYKDNKYYKVYFREITGKQYRDFFHVYCGLTPKDAFRKGKNYIRKILREEADANIFIDSSKGENGVEFIPGLK